MESRVRLACNKQLDVSCAYPLWNEPPSPHSPSIQKEPKSYADAGCVSKELSSSIHSSLSVPSLETTHCSGGGLRKLLGYHSLAHCSGAGLLASHSLWHYCSRKQSLEFWNLWASHQRSLWWWEAHKWKSSYLYMSDMYLICTTSVSKQYKLMKKQISHDYYSQIVAQRSLWWSFSSEALWTSHQHKLLWATIWE